MADRVPIAVIDPVSDLVERGQEGLALPGIQGLQHQILHLIRQWIRFAAQSTAFWGRDEMELPGVIGIVGSLDEASLDQSL